MTQQFMDDKVWEKDYGPFRVFVYINDEDIDPKDMFPADSNPIEKIIKQIEAGDKIWVQARAEVWCKGVELGSANIGGLLYDDNESLVQEVCENDCNDIVHEALKEARATMKYLRSVKMPAEEQLTSQFMEGQVY